MAVWKNGVEPPYGLTWNYISRDRFEIFAQRFNLAETFGRNLDEFYNVNKFMKDGKNPTTDSYFLDFKHRLLPKEHNKHTTAYRDADGHVLVVAFGSSVKEDVVEESVRDKDLVAVVLDSSHNFYRDNYHFYAITDAATYEYFSSKGCYGDWAIKVLR